MKSVNSKKIGIDFKLKKILALATYSKIDIIGKGNKRFLTWASQSKVGGSINIPTWVARQFKTKCTSPPTTDEIFAKLSSIYRLRVTKGLEAQKTLDTRSFNVATACKTYRS